MNGLDPWYIFGFLSALVVLLALTKHLGFSLLEPANAFLASWFLLMFFFLLNLVVYDRIFVAESFLSLLAAIALFVLGTIAARSPVKHVHDKRIELEFSATSIRCLVSATLLYVAIQGWEVIDFLRLGGFSAVSLVELRVEHIDAYLSGQVTGVGVLKAFARVCATIVAVAAPIFSSKRRFGLLALSGLCVTMLAAESVLQGGRTLLGYIFLAIIYMYLLIVGRNDGENMLRRRWKGLSITAALLVVFVYVMLIYVPAVRNPDLASNVGFFLGRVHNADLSDWVYASSSIPGLEGLSIFAYASSYITQPIVKYSFFIENTKIESWYTLGTYNFPFVAKVVAVFTGDMNEWSVIRARLAVESTRFGYAGNPWATGIRDLVIDFGYFGMAAVMFLFGYLGQKAFERARASGSAEWVVLAALLGPVYFLFAFFSPFPIGLFANTVLIAGFFLVLRWVMGAFLNSARKRAYG